MQVIHSKEDGVCHPIGLSENSTHLGQEYAVPEEFLTQEIVEDKTEQGNSQEPPLAFEGGAGQL